MLVMFLHAINDQYGEVVRIVIGFITFLAAVYYARFQRKLFVRFVKNDTIKTYSNHYLQLSVIIKEISITDFADLISKYKSVSSEPRYSKINNDFLNLYFESHLFDSHKIKSLVDEVRSAIVELNEIIEHFMFENTTNDVITIDTNNIIYQKVNVLQDLHIKAKNLYLDEIKSLRFKNI